MWLWWFLSLLILIICLIFAFRIFTTSRYLFRQVLGEDQDAMGNARQPRQKAFFKPDPQEQAILLLKTRLQEVMSNSDRYVDQLNRLTNRLEALETGQILTPQKKNEPDEDWEELYYEVHKQKENLENELDLTQQSLQKVEEKMLELERKELAHSELMSRLEGELHNIYTLQEKLDEVQRKLEGGRDRESDLQDQLNLEIKEKEKFRAMEKDYVRLQSVTDELRRMLQEMEQRNRVAEQKISRLSELESTLDATEYEKSDLRKTVEDIIMENEALALKLQELQDKLGTEKYA